MIRPIALVLSLSFASCLFGAEPDDLPTGTGGVIDGSKPLKISGPLVSLNGAGKLIYKPYTERGDVIPDFSMCGYRGGNQPLPKVPVKGQLAASNDPKADDTSRFQKAVDELAKLPVGTDGFRGALLIEPGTYRIADAIKLTTSGIVIRGSGTGAGGTKVTGTGDKVRPLFEVRGGSPDRAAKKFPISDEYVPVGATSFHSSHAKEFKIGQGVIVTRQGNEAWIKALNMDRLIVRSGTIQWKPFTIDHDRVITAIDGDKITVDAPLTCAIDAQWGGGEIAPFDDSDRIENVGIENLAGDSEFDASVSSVVGVKKGGSAYPADEKHATQVIEFENCKNCWARDIVATHFVHGVARAMHGAKWITVQDASASEPISIITGGRRYPYCTEGQLCLFLRCLSTSERHAFVNNGSHVPGPNAFVMCESKDDHADSGPHQRWSTGTLWDCVSGVMHTQDRQNMGSGHGWSGANDVYWNCRGEITIEQPQTAQNFAIGFVGTKAPAAFARLKHPEGYYENFGTPVKPQSLYVEQLKQRIGEAKAMELIGTKPSPVR